MVGEIYEDPFFFFFCSFYIYSLCSLYFKLYLLCSYEHRISCFSFQPFCRLKPGIKDVYEVFF